MIHGLSDLVYMVHDDSNLLMAESICNHGKHLYSMYDMADSFIVTWLTACMT